MQLNDTFLREVQDRLDRKQYVPKAWIQTLVDRVKELEAEINHLALIVARGNSHDDPGDGGS
jgi:hypothetical protein